MRKAAVVVRSQQLHFLWKVAAPLLLVMLLASGCGDDEVQANSTPAVRPEQLVGQPMPDVTGDNLTGNGRATLSSFKGSQPMVVAIWLNACPDCQKVMPDLQKLADRMPTIRFVSVAIDEKDANGSGPKGYETPKAFVLTAGLTMPSLLAPRAEVDSAFRLYRIPTVFLMDSTGLVRATFVWPFTVAEVEAAAAELR